MKVFNGLAGRIPALEWIDRAREALAAAQTFEGVADLAEDARMAEALLECKQRGSEAHAEAWAFVCETTRKIGVMSLAMPKAKRGPKSESEISPPGGENEPALSKTDRLADMNVSSARASEAEKVARLPEEEFRGRIDAGKEQIRNGKRPKPIHVVTSAVGHDGDSFSTPARYIEAARKVMGGIDLDPATNPSAQKVVQAERFFLREDDALQHSWDANSCWLNPPYSRGLINPFVRKLLAEIEAGRVGSAIMLVNADCSTSWYQAALQAAVAFCLLDHRIAFEIDGVPARGNEHPQTFFYWGPKLPLFARTFKEFGTVCVRYAR